MESHGNSARGTAIESLHGPVGVTLPSPQVAGMSEEEYGLLRAALAAATAVFARHQGELSAGDLRARSLVSLADREAARSELEAQFRHRHEIAVQEARAP